MANAIRVLVVDDSALVRKAVTDALKPDPEIEVVGTASNGKIGLERIQELEPDVVVLDIEMPVCDGFGVLKELRSMRTPVRTIMFSTLTERGAIQTIRALSLGANDYVAKPSSQGSVGGYTQSVQRVAAELTPKIKQFGGKITAKREVRRPTPGMSRSLPARPTTPLRGRVNGASATMSSARPTSFSKPRRSGLSGGTPDVVAIGISTGGPEALAKVLPGLPAGFPLPILIVQHMPPIFTRLLAQRLDGASKIKVVEAEAGMAIKAGVAYIAPGDHHMTVGKDRGKYALFLNQGPPENSCRPAADVLFRSVAETYGAKALGVIMTGMGQDGFKGIQKMKEKGMTIFAQDEASSVVWGMPAVVVREGLADKVLPLDQLAGAITNCASARVPV